MCVACLISQNFSCFALPMQAVPHTQRISKCRPVSAGPGAYTSWSVTLHTCTIPFVSLSSLLPHFVPCYLTSQFCFLLSPPLSPSFRVIWLNQTLFLGRPRSPLSRSDPPIISPTSFLTVPSLQTAFFPRASLSPSHFSFSPSPFLTGPSLFSLCSHTSRLVSSFV